VADEGKFADGPLAGIRVLDISTMLAGPFAGTLLGDLGADVIKVESHYGDDSRHLGPERGGQHSPFLGLNRNKRSLVVDLQKDESREVFARLLDTSDVVITNVREPALSKLGLAYEQVKALKKDIIWVGVTAFGPDGPYAGRPGIDFLAQGYAGLLALTGHPEYPPVRVTVPVVDTMTSLHVSVGILAALRVRDRTGEGQQIDMCLLDAVVHANASGLAAWFLNREETPRTGNRSQYFAPSGVYPTADGKEVCITCPSDKFFRNLCAALESDMIDDERFRNVAGRLEHQEELDRNVAAACSKFSRSEVIERLVAADVLAAPINGITEVPEDPQVLHNEMIVETEHKTLGPLKVTGVPIKMRGTPGSVRMAPPVHGEHTRDLLAELGFDAAQIEKLAADGIVGLDD
jgi:crotonobetainyl-CoA:carnitine CoA-transferase CaiB-like acyl-CoA transferase